MVSEAELSAATLEMSKLRAAEAGGCFNPVDDPQGECADGDCYCSRQCRREARAALEAAARVREEDNAGEPVAWRYRYTDPVSGKPVWRYDNRLWNGQRPYESQPLYARPAPQPSGKVEAQFSPVWLQNLIGFLDGVFPDDAAWRATWLKQLRALALTAGKPEQRRCTQCGGSGNFCHCSPHRRG